MDRPTRLLSIDGGGIRGVIAAEVLVRIEEILQAQSAGAYDKGLCFGKAFAELLHPSGVIRPTALDL